MRVQCHLSEDEIKIAIAEWFKTLGKIIHPSDVTISHSTSTKYGGDHTVYAASLSYQQVSD